MKKLAIAVLALTGCTTPGMRTSKPCYFEVSFRLDNHDVVNRDCHKHSKWSDSGEPTKDSTWINGCISSYPDGTSDAIVSDSESNWGHEVGHAVDFHCRRKGRRRG